MTRFRTFKINLQSLEKNEENVSVTFILALLFLESTYSVLSPAMGVRRNFPLLITLPYVLDLFVLHDVFICANIWTFIFEIKLVHHSNWLIHFSEPEFEFTKFLWRGSHSVCICNSCAPLARREVDTEKSQDTPWQASVNNKETLS